MTIDKSIVILRSEIQKPTELELIKIFTWLKFSQLWAVCIFRSSFWFPAITLRFVLSIITWQENKISRHRCKTYHKWQENGFCQHNLLFFYMSGTKRSPYRQNKDTWNSGSLEKRKNKNKKWALKLKKWFARTKKLIN